MDWGGVGQLLRQVCALGCALSRDSYACSRLSVPDSQVVFRLRERRTKTTVAVLGQWPGGWWRWKLWRSPVRIKDNCARISGAGRSSRVQGYSQLNSEFKTCSTSYEGL